MLDKVFVYGTLMRGNKYHRYYLAQSEFLGIGEISGYALYEVSYYPAIVPENGERVKGEVYRIDQDTLNKLDKLEDEGSLYLRKIVEVQLNGGAVQAWTYIWNHDVTGKAKVKYEDQPWRSKREVNKRYVW